MTLCYARLAGTHVRLASAEIDAIIEAEGLNARQLAVHSLISILDCSDPPRLVAERLGSRAAYARSFGIILDAYDSPDEVLASAADLASKIGQIDSSGPIRVEAHRVLGLWRDIDPQRHAMLLAAALNSRGTPTSPRGTTVLELLYVEGFVIAGLVLAKLDTKSFLERSPGKRPFFKPGPLDPFLSRALVNLSRLRRDSVFWDPFCGTGGIALEACLIGASKVLCGDLDPKMAAGSSLNLRHYGCGSQSLSHMADAAAPPVAPKTVDAIATDPPYGRSTSLRGRRHEDLYKSFLREAYIRLKPGSYVVFAAPVQLRASILAEEEGFAVRDRYYMYVHGSLTREIVVARRV